MKKQLTGFMMVAMVCGKVEKVWDNIQEMDTLKERAIDALTNGFFNGQKLIAESIQVRGENSDGTTNYITTWNNVNEVNGTL